MHTVSNISNSARKPRMQDIAARANVSIGTVSRVLNGKPDVTAELVERVMRTAQAMGYGIRNADRQASKRSRDVYSLGYIVDSANETGVTAEPFQQHFLSGIEHTVTEHGGHLVFSTCRNEILKDAIPAMITEHLVSGVILKVNNETPEDWVKKISSLIPLVLLMHRSVDTPISSVMCDNRGAVFQAMRHLRDLGHTRIGFFFENEQSPRKNSLHHDERLDAYIKCVSLMGLKFRPEYIQTPTRDPQGDLTGVTHEALKNYLSLDHQRPTAVVCAADVHALTLLRVAESHGLELPRDLSVVGIMNTPACDFASPALTSVALSEGEIGRAAVDLLEERIERPFASPREIIVGSHLVERGSCTKAPR